MTHDAASERAFDAHVVQAAKLFRDVGFTLAAMQFPRPAEALLGLKRFNGVPDNWSEPVGWRYFPNAYMRDNWQRYYGLAHHQPTTGREGE